MLECSKSEEEASAATLLILPLTLSLFSHMMHSLAHPFILLCKYVLSFLHFSLKIHIGLHKEGKDKEKTFPRK